MAKCKNCKHMIYQKVVFNYTTTEYPYCPTFEECLDDIEKEIVCSGFEGMTNADRIRSMTDEELAEFLDDIAYCCKGRGNETYCSNCRFYFIGECDCVSIGKWLKSEVGVSNE